MQELIGKTEAEERLSGFTFDEDTTADDVLSALFPHEGAVADATTPDDGSDDGSPDHKPGH